jgi:hypothetical protein
MSVLSLRLDTLPRDIDVDDEGLFSILSNFLQPTSASSTSEAAQAVIKLGLESEGQPSYFMSAFFEIAMHLARQIPHNHPSQDRLVDLIQALRSTPASDDGQSPWSNFLLHASGEISEIYGGKTLFLDTRVNSKLKAVPRAHFPIRKHICARQRCHADGR